MATQVTFKATATGNGKLAASVDHNVLQFNDGTATFTLTSGSHLLTWIISGGKSGDIYSIEISDPSSAVFQHSDTLDGEGFDAGGHKFTL